MCSGLPKIEVRDGWVTFPLGLLSNILHIGDASTGTLSAPDSQTHGHKYILGEALKWSCCSSMVWPISANWEGGGGAKFEPLQNQLTESVTDSDCLNGRVCSSELQELINTSRELLAFLAVAFWSVEVFLFAEIEVYKKATWFWSGGGGGMVRGHNYPALGEILLIKNLGPDPQNDSPAFEPKKCYQ